jgi:CRISPR-associated protein Csx10
MIELELTLETEAPLVLRASRTSAQFTPTLTYIPGVALRGALALEYLRQGGTPNGELFRQIFLSEAVSFGPLFPSKSDAAGRPLPLSAVACKRYGAQHTESVGDALLRLELTDVLGSLKPLEDWEECPVCRDTYQGVEPNKRDRLTGYYLEQDEFQTIKPVVRMLTGVGISRTTRTAAQGILFSMEAIETVPPPERGDNNKETKRAECFKGQIRFYGDEVERLAERVKELVPEDAILRLGAARSRGQGRVRVVGWQGVSQDGPALAERWDALNAVVRRLWTQYGVEPEGEYFTLTLESPLILRDDCLRPVRPDNLSAQSFGLPAEVERRRFVLDEVVLQGWNAAWRLPKRDTPAMGMGSVFLFRVPLGQRDTVLTRLEEIEQRGLGEQRNQGFGRVRVCDPFHYRFEEVSG